VIKLIIEQDRQYSIT